MRTAYFALSSVNQLVCHRRRPRCSIIVADLTPAWARQDHTTSPSAKDAVRRSAHPRPPQPASRVVTIAIRPSAIEAGWRIANANFWKNERRIFLREGLDSPNQFELLQEISSCVHRFERRQAE
jgi:hypothetical protein